MQTQTSEANQNFLEELRPINTSLISFDLPGLIDILKQSLAWEKGELSTMVLLKSPRKQILLIALHKGTEINSFQSKEAVTLQIVEGRIEFHTWEGSVILNKGQVHTLDENIKYSLISSEETVFLLTVSNGILQPVAK